MFLFVESTDPIKRKGTMMFSPRMLPLSLLVCMLMGMCVSGCVKVLNNVTAPAEHNPSNDDNTKAFKVFNQKTIFEIEVRTAAGVSLSPAEVNNIFRAASEVAKHSDGQGDVECSLEFVLAKNVVEKFDSPQIIRDFYDIDELNKKFNGLKVVEEIRWCEQFWPDIIGCQWDNGIFAVRTLPSLEPILTLHEAGHAKNLPHRNEPNAVMNEFILPMNKWLNANECALYQ